MKQKIILIVEFKPDLANRIGLDRLMHFLDSGLLPEVRKVYTGDKTLAALNHHDALEEAGPFKGMFDFTFYYEGGVLESGISVFSSSFKVSFTLDCEPSEADFFSVLIHRVCEEFPVSWANVSPLFGMSLLSSQYSKAPRTSNCSGLYWLQYWGKEEVVAQGGLEKLLLTQEIQARPLGNGILIQVGDSPHDMISEAGMKRLLDATLALPPVSK